VALGTWVLHTFPRVGWTGAASPPYMRLISFAFSVAQVDGALQLGRSSVGRVAPYTPVGINNTISLWLYRPKGPLDDTYVEGKVEEASGPTRSHVLTRRHRSHRTLP
jgi:hypothetical protein